MGNNDTVVNTVGILVAFEIAFVSLLTPEDNDDTFVMEVPWIDPTTLSVDVSLVGVLLVGTCGVLAILSFKVVIGTDPSIFFKIIAKNNSGHRL